MKKFNYLARLARNTPVSKRYPHGFYLYAFLSAIATSEQEARELIEAYLAEGRPLGFSEREMRKRNPKRLSSGPDVWIFQFCLRDEVPDDSPIGVVSDGN